MSRVTFDVYGSAQPQGSKTKMPNGAMLEGGTAELRANRRNWRSAVAAAAADALADQLAGRQMDGPLSLDVVFRAPMPASRPKWMRALGCWWKPTAPDLDKLVRSVGDSLTASGLIKDDARIVALRAMKIEVDGWTGATISVHEIGIIDAHVHAICRTPHIADRIAQLLDRHGLADIPDTPADLVPE